MTNEWIDHPPSKAGLYWLKRNRLKPVLVAVEADGKVFVVFVSELDGAGIYLGSTKSFNDGSLWAGPVLPPKGRR